MSKTIQIKYKWNKKNVEKLFDSSYAYIFNNSAQRYIGWFFLALSQFSIVAALKKDSFALLLFGIKLILLTELDVNEQIPYK